MNIKSLLTAAALAAPALPAFAQYGGGPAPGAGLDLYAFAGYNFQEIDDGLGIVEPDGADLGVRGKVYLGGNGLFLGGEYTYSDVDSDFGGSRLSYQGDEFRLGGGILAPISPIFRLGAYGHYVNQEVETRFEGLNVTGEADGFDVGALFEFDAAPDVQTYGRIGYMSLSPNDSGNDEDRFTGVDLLAGLSFRISRSTSLFGEYRYTALENDFVKQDYNSVRGGVRFEF